MDETLADYSFGYQDKANGILKMLEYVGFLVTVMLVLYSTIKGTHKNAATENHLRSTLHDFTDKCI